MNDRTKLGLGVLDAALILGVLADALLRVTPWGLNVLLWIIALAVAAMVLVRWRGLRLSGEGRKLILPAILLAFGFTWRDSMVLKFLDGLALLVALCLAAQRARSGRILIAGVTEYAREVLTAIIGAIFGAWPLLRRDILWNDVPRAGWSRYAAAIARGFVIAVPLLIIFGGLLMSADVVFDKIISNIFQFNLYALFLHFFVALAGAWLVGGFLRTALLRNASATHPVENNATLGGDGVATSELAADERCSVSHSFKSWSLGIVEVSIGLGLLNVLFFCFVVVQFRYFFGGATLVESSTGMTYAEYARRGFFELVTVATLVLPLLLIADWLLRESAMLHKKIFGALALTQLALVFVIMTSAVVRMRLYQCEYGLTELRLYTTAFMAWLAMIFVWFALTVLRDKREQFACGALAASFIIVALLHLLNPDAFIVRANVAQASKMNQKFDTDYATSLSADAVPTLIKLLPIMNQRDARVISSYILERWSPPEHVDYRAWSVSRSAAWSVRQRRELDLRAFAR